MINYHLGYNLTNLYADDKTFVIQFYGAVSPVHLACD